MCARACMCVCARCVCLLARLDGQARASAEESAARVRGCIGVHMCALSEPDVLMCVYVCVCVCVMAAGLPWSQNLVRRTLLECEGTRLTALLALQVTIKMCVCVCVCVCVCCVCVCVHPQTITMHACLITERVLSLQNVFSHYRTCSVTTGGASM